MSTFIVSVTEARIVGYVVNQDVAKEKAGEGLVVSSADDLEVLSNQQLTELYNGLTGESKGLFKSAKADNAKKVFEIMKAKDLAELVQLDKVEEAKVEEQAQNLEIQEAATPASPEPSNGAGPKVRKVRDSKLQRMKACFLEKDDEGNFKHWTIKELMERCGKPDDPMTERIANVYISILRSPTDRFVMPISKDKDKGTFVYTPDQPSA
jgi:hypothetical protein